MKGLWRSGLRCDTYREEDGDRALGEHDPSRSFSYNHETVRKSAKIADVRTTFYRSFHRLFFFQREARAGFVAAVFY